MRRWAAFGLFVAAVAWLPSGCQSIAGIKDHTFPAQCDPYCTDVRRCPSTAGNYSSLYVSKQTCLGICTDLAPGSALEGQSNNTVACRDSQLNLAEINCQAAGPGGGGTCGTNCEAYCSLLHKICSDKFDSDFPPSSADPEALCQQVCTTGLTPVPYSVDDPVINVADTLQCRLWHLSTATVEGISHCEHAQLHPNTQCADDPAGTGYCTHFCKLNQAACGNFAYESMDQCLAVCAALPAGPQDDSAGNTRACRLWHSYSALGFPDTHCPHTTAGGDGHCGLDNCESYCLLINTPAFKSACPAEASQITPAAECKVACDTLPGAGADKWTSVDAGAGGTVPCLLKHVNRILAGGASSDAGPTACQMATRLADCE
jgi:hypothetical protein